MRRGRYSKTVSHATLNRLFFHCGELSTYAKRQIRQYNRIVRTNATIRHPGWCPNGKSKCRLCSTKNYKGKNYEKGGSDTWRKFLDYFSN